MVDAATRLCYKTIAGSLKAHDGFITEEAGKHAMKLLRLLKPIFVDYIEKFMELLDRKVDKQRREDLYVAILMLGCELKRKSNKALKQWCNSSDYSV